MKQGKFKRELTLSELIFIGFGSMFGSGWLFASSHVAAIAGPAGIFSWIIGGFAILLLGLVFSELGAALPYAGAVVRFPVYSHGPIMGYLIGFITLIANTSLVAIEVEAARQYANSWLPFLTENGETMPTIWGWLFQFALLTGFFCLNYWSVKVFARSNTIITLFKFIVPLLTIIVLLTQIKFQNFTVSHFAPFGISGVQSAISVGGVIFAYLGLTPIVSIASEVKSPQRTIPVALILSAVLATVVYLFLQVAFIGGIPTHSLASSGWAGIASQFSLPYRDIAISLGFTWLTIFIVADAVISPTGTGNIFMSASARTVYGWAKSGTLFSIFKRIDSRSGVPRPALWLSYILTIFWTLPFPSWEALIGVVSAALILSYAIAPVAVAALRRNAPSLPRPFYLKGLSFIGPISFIIASLIVYWSGWGTISWLLGSQIIMFLIYLIFKRFVPTDKVPLRQQVRSSIWLVVYYTLMMVISYLGTFGGINVLRAPYDFIVVMVLALATYYYGTYSCLPQAIFDQAEDETDDDLQSIS
ncbi:MAG: APC family permease [Sporolactobacillus sp.]